MADKNDQTEDQFDEYDTIIDDTVSDDALTDDAFAQIPEEDAPRNKRKLLFYIIAALLVVSGVLSAWFVFFNKPAVETPLAQAPAPVPAPVAENPTPGALPPGVTPAQPAPETAAASVDTGLPAPTPLDDAQAQADLAAGTAEALPPPAAMEGSPLVPSDAPAVPIAPMADPIAAETPVAPAADVMAAPAAEIPATLPPVEQPAALPPATAENLQPVDAAPVAAVVDEAANARIAQLENQVKELAAALEAVRAARDQAKDQAAKAPSGSTAGVAGLNQKVEQITQQIEALDQRTATLATELQNRPVEIRAAAEPDDAPIAVNDISKMDERAETSAPLAPVTAPKPAVKKPAVRRTVWELRSAQPGVAWLGKPGGSEMSRYAVGETVPGLGRVTAVGQESGKWTVRTTGGTIHE